MIEINFKDVFTEDFVNKYTTSMMDKISPFNFNFNFDNVSVNISIDNDDLIFLFFDPFFSSLCKNDFISDYYKISNFLLHSRQYFLYLKKQWKEEGLSRKEQKTKLYDERCKIIEKFGLIKLINCPSLKSYDSIVNDKQYYEFYKKVNNYFALLNENIKEHITYDFIDSDMRSCIIKKVNIKVCPYCNRQYIGYYDFDKKQKNIASLDHFYPQSKFPLYSVSLLNLIPSCAYCNGMVKKDRLYPIKHIYTEVVEDEVYFSLKYSSIDGIFGKLNDFELLTSDGVQQRLRSYFFRHRELYLTHSDDICLWLSKKRLHNESYRRHLSDVLKKNITEDELKMFLFETTGSASDVINKPLGKLKKDILKI